MEKLLPQHFSDLDKSTLIGASIEKYEFSSISQEEADKLLGFNAPSGGWMIKYPESDFLKFKPDKPIGKCKYLSPKGMKQDLFITHLAREKHNDLTVPYFFTEGEKKAIALEQLGYAAISIPGVWNFSSQGHYNEILSQLNLSGRESFITFDSDKYEKKNVFLAEMRFAECLNSLKAEVRIVNLDKALGKGIDDQIKEFTDKHNLGDLKTNYIDKAEIYESYMERCQGMFKGGGLVVVADNICKQYKLIYCVETFYIYKEGVYRSIDNEIVRRLIIQKVGTDISSRKTNEIFFFAKTCAFIEVEELNNTSYLNLKNGFFDLETYLLHPHSHEVYSIIQLDVTYDLLAKCEKWLKALNEIFEGDQEKIALLQEFLGLCLTKETKYQKALICIGEGANGKSVILSIFEILIGRKNCSAVPLEKFDNRHYLAGLFGKLVNISIETNAKSAVYDSTFKAVTTGDLIAGDRKFGHPFEFHSFCKLIFAMNNLPRVDDKTDAFYRRLLIIRFLKVFKEDEDNKNLKDELVSEIDGIFLWCVEGYKRLKERGRFKEIDSIRQEVEEYKKENNNVLIFVDEECILIPGVFVKKDQLYKAYVDYCEPNGYHQLSKTNFGKAIKKHFNLDPGTRMGDKDGTRIWKGIALRTDMQL